MNLSPAGSARCAILSLLLIFSASCTKKPSSVAGVHIYPLNLQQSYSAGNFAFLKQLVGPRSMVQLGESIHMTAEFPQARLLFVKYLHEQMGFDVLAFEGSAVSAWLAQDRIYWSKEAGSTIAGRAQEAAWFNLWQTDAMRAVMEYVVLTRGTPHPLYLTSFDMQTGASREFKGEANSHSTLFSQL